MSVTKAVLGPGAASRLWGIAADAEEASKRQVIPIFGHNRGLEAELFADQELLTGLDSERATPLFPRNRKELTKQLTSALKKAICLGARELWIVYCGHCDGERLELGEDISDGHVGAPADILGAASGSSTTASPTAVVGECTVTAEQLRESIWSAAKAVCDAVGVGVFPTGSINVLLNCCFAAQFALRMAGSGGSLDDGLDNLVKHYRNIVYNRCILDQRVAKQIFTATIAEKIDSVHYELTRDEAELLTERWSSTPFYAATTPEQRRVAQCYLSMYHTSQHKRLLDMLGNPRTAEEMLDAADLTWLLAYALYDDASKAPLARVPRITVVTPPPGRPALYPIPLSFGPMPATGFLCDLMFGGRARSSPAAAHSVDNVTALTADFERLDASTGSAPGAAGAGAGRGSPATPTPRSLTHLDREVAAITGAARNVHDHINNPHVSWPSADSSRPIGDSREWEQPTVVTFKAGSGDCSILHWRDFCVLVDGGQNAAVPCFAEYLNSVARVDAVLLTHGDYDHAGGLLGLFRDDAHGSPAAVRAKLSEAVFIGHGEPDVRALRHANVLAGRARDVLHPTRVLRTCKQGDSVALTRHRPDGTTDTIRINVVWPTQAWFDALQWRLQGAAVRDFIFDGSWDAMRRVQLLPKALLKRVEAIVTGSRKIGSSLELAELKLLRKELWSLEPGSTAQASWAEFLPDLDKVLGRFEFELEPDRGDSSPLSAGEKQVTFINVAGTVYHITCTDGEQPEAPFHLLFTGDALGRDVEAGLKACGLEKQEFDYMDMPHHGSDFNVFPSILRDSSLLPSPRWITVSTNGNNGHPGSSVLKLLAEHLVAHEDARVHFNHATFNETREGMAGLFDTRDVRNELTTFVRGELHRLLRTAPALALGGPATEAALAATAAGMDAREPKGLPRTVAPSGPAAAATGAGGPTTAPRRRTRSTRTANALSAVAVAAPASSEAAAGAGRPVPANVTLVAAAGGAAPSATSAELEEELRAVMGRVHFQRGAFEFISLARHGAVKV